MACSSCNNGNSLSSCGCQDNCPTKTSEFLFDGVFSSIPVPAGATLNDVLLLLESYTLSSISNLNIEFELSGGTCLDLTPGTYSYQQIIEAVIVYMCGLGVDVGNIQNDIIALEENNILEWNDITLVNGWVETNAMNNPAQYAIQNGLMYLKGEIQIASATVLNRIFWNTVPMTGIIRNIETTAYEKISIDSVLIKISSGEMSYQGPTSQASKIVLDSIPVIRLTN